MDPAQLHFYTYRPKNVDDSLAPAVFIHGLLSTNGTWNRVKLSVSERTRRKVYAVDLRNHGKSEWSDDMSLQHLVADLENFLAEQKIERVALIGHSVGGRVAMTVALKHPDLVESLVVEDISIAEVDDVPYQRGLMALRFLRRALAGFPKAMSELEASKKINDILKNFWPQLSKGQSGPDVGSMMPFYKNPSGQFVIDANVDVIQMALEDKAIFAMDVSDQVYRGRALFVFGEFTEVPYQKDKKHVLKHFPEARFEIWKKGTHVIHVELSDKFVEDISAFLNQH